MVGLLWVFGFFFFYYGFIAGGGFHGGGGVRDHIAFGPKYNLCKNYKVLILVTIYQNKR